MTDLKCCPNPECGSENLRFLDWGTGNEDQVECQECITAGPGDDPTGEKWNALPRAEPKPAGRTVRVRLALFRLGSRQHQEVLFADDFDPASDTPDAYVEADVPLPEEPGVIEGRVAGAE
jgi:hypothetical protein